MQTINNANATQGETILPGFLSQKLTFRVWNRQTEAMNDVIGTLEAFDSVYFRITDGTRDGVSFKNILVRRDLVDEFDLGTSGLNAQAA